MFQPIPVDYQPPENDNNFNSVEDAQYSIEAIDFMEKSIDKATQKPRLVDSSFGPVVMLDLSVVSSEITIPLSCKLEEIPYLVQGFTGNAGSLLPKVPSLDQLPAIENYLIQAIQLCNKGTTRPTMGTKNGWGGVYRLSNAKVPKGIYHGYFTDILTKNNIGLPAHKPSDRFPDVSQFDGIFLIVADQYGKECGWSGARLMSKYIGYKSVAVEDDKGQLKPDWIRGPKTGEYTASSKAFSNFVAITAPSLFTGVNFQDPHNICPEWLAAVQRDSVLISFQVDINKKGYNTLDIDSIVMADTRNVEVSAGTTPRQEILPDTNNVAVPTTEIEDKKHVKVLVDLFNMLLPDDAKKFDGKAFPPKNLRTEEQKQIIASNLTPLKDQLSTGKLNQLTPYDVSIIFENLSFDSVSDDDTGKIAELYQVVEELLEQPPF